MPFQSAAQKNYLFAKHPDIAKRWAHEEEQPIHMSDGGMVTHENMVCPNCNYAFGGEIDPGGDGVQSSPVVDAANFLSDPDGDDDDDFAESMPEDDESAEEDDEEGRKSKFEKILSKRYSK